MLAMRRSPEIYECLSFAWKQSLGASRRLQQPPIFNRNLAWKRGFRRTCQERVQILRAKPRTSANGEHEHPTILALRLWSLHSQPQRKEPEASFQGGLFIGRCILKWECSRDKGARTNRKWTMRYWWLQCSAVNRSLANFCHSEESLLEENALKTETIYRVIQKSRSASTRHRSCNFWTN